MNIFLLIMCYKYAVNELSDKLRQNNIAWNVTYLTVENVKTACQFSKCYNQKVTLQFSDKAYYVSYLQNLILT